jgi:light-regulated signal transduction histidine kinase (bacteriophytochrome)
MPETLRMMSNFSQMLVKKLDGKLDNECQKYFDIITTSAIRMQGLIDDLLEYAKCDKDIEDLQQTDLNESLQYVLENLSESIKETNPRIDFKELPTVEVNPVKIASVLQNLISNAIKYRKKDRILNIVISAEEADEHWEICIKDNGIGMKQEYCEQIFLPFKRLHHKSEYSGTGIGLAICNKTIRKFGGEIWARSEPNKGTKLFFTIPKKSKKALKIANSKVAL